MTYTYKITLAHHIANTWTIFIAVVGSIAAPFYMKYRFGSEDFQLFVKMSIVLFLIFFIPQLFIHLRYYFMDKGRQFYYTPNTGEIGIEIGGKIHEFGFDDIEYIERNKSYPMAANWFHWMPWDNYNYSVIKLNDGRQFVVTSLLVLQLDLPLKESKIELRKRFYCYPFDVVENLEKSVPSTNSSSVL